MFKSMFGRGPKPAVDNDVPLDGAYRRHRDMDIDRFTRLAGDAFPDYSQRIRCFGADWLGRQFASDSDRSENGTPLVLMLEPGTGEVLEIPATVADFHAHELIEQAEAVAAVSFFKAWHAAGGAKPAYGQCIGYRVPLFLGGEDTVANLELSDLDVYWTIAAQLLTQARRHPSGTAVGGVAIGE